MPARKLVRLDVAAEQYDVSVKTVRKWIATGQITGYRLGERTIRVDPAELEAFARPIPTAGSVA